MLAYTGYALILVALMALAEARGARSPRAPASSWGIAGFVAAHFAPGVSLAPELPGVAAADIGARQIWWFATVASAAVALWLVAFGRGWSAWGIAVALLLGAAHRRRARTRGVRRAGPARTRRAVRRAGLRRRRGGVGRCSASSPATSGSARASGSTRRRPPDRAGGNADMERLALFAIGLVFGGGIGFVVAAATGATLDGHDHDAHRDGGAAVAHAAGHEEAAPLVLPDGPDAPAVRMTLTPDSVAGWNLHVETANFRFAPENSGRAPISGEGHAHVYLDGQKIARLYGPWMHLPALPEGARLEVTLNGNDHRPLAVGAEPVTASTRVPAPLVTAAPARGS